MECDSREEKNSILFGTVLCLRARHSMTEALEQNTPFSSLLFTIGKALETQQVRSMKHLLQGHMNRETLQHLDTGQQLTDALKKRGLVTERKLAFLRKLLVEAKSLKLVDLLDDYKSQVSAPTNKTDVEQKSRASRQNGRREVLLRMIERVENEIQTCEEGQAEFVHQLKQCEMQIESDSEKLVLLEENVRQSKENIKENESQIEMCEQKLETVRFFLKKQQVQIDKLKKERDKDNSNMNLKRELKEKENEQEKNKKGEDELLAKHQETLDRIRTAHVEIRHHTTDSIRLEDNIHDYLMQIRATKHGVRKGKRTMVELQEKLEDLSFELEQTKRLKPLTPGSRPQSRVNISSEVHTQDTRKERVEFRMLDYGELTESEALVVGRKGKRVSPPQFNTPCSVAADRFGNVYVGDYGNGRIQVIGADGRTARQPLNIGGKFRPCALAVSIKGDIALTDSQIIRLFGRNGQPLRPILPVFSKNDRRPELSALAFDIQGNIYVADKANHRLEKFNFDGHFVCFIGSPQCLHQPTGVAVTRGGHIVVSEHSKHRLRVFFREHMTEVNTIGAKGVGNCKFMCPRGLALDKHENILVADSENHRIQVVSITGEFIGAFGKIGCEAGFLDTPHDVAVDTDGNVIVADTKNHRVQVYTRSVPVYVEHEMYNRDDATSCHDVMREDNDATRREIIKAKTELKENGDGCLNADDEVQTRQQEEHNGNSVENKQECTEMCKLDSENIRNKSANSPIDSENKEKTSADNLDKQVDSHTH